MEIEWVAEQTKEGYPMAVLYDGDVAILKVYMSKDAKNFRIVLSEFQILNQLKVDVTNKLIDFRRKA